MADYLANGNDLTAIANAIRAKGGTSASLEFPNDFIDAVGDIVSVSDVPQRSSSDLSASGATVTAPSGYYSADVTKTISSGSATAPSTISGTSATVSHSGTTLTLNKTVSVTPMVTSGYVSSGTAGNASVSLSATDANFVAGNIKKNVSLFGLTGSYEGGGGGGGYGTLLSTTAIGAISTSSTTAADTGKTATVNGVGNYDLLIVEISVDTKTNNRHASTCQTIWLTADTTVGTKSGTAIATATLNTKLSSNGTATTRSSTTKCGIYVNSASVSSNNVTLAFYRRYNSTQTGTINGSYTARVYGFNLYDLIGG